MNLYTKILATVLLTLTVCVLSVALLFHVVFTRIIDGSRIQMMTEAPAHLDALPVYYDEILTFDLPRVAGFSNLEYIVATSNGYVIDASGQLCEHDEEYEECLSRKDIYMVPIYIEDLDEVGLFAAEVESVDETHERSVFFLGLGLILLIVTLGVLPLTRLLTQPLTRLREVVERFASGNLSARVKPDGPEEIRALAQTFNAMADSLERNIKGHKELTANVSHELRSPLARIRLIQEILADRLGTVGDNGDKDERVAKLMGDMEQEIESMDKLIGRILRLSKLDSLDSFTQVEELDLADMVRASCSSFSRLIKASGLSVNLSLPDQCPMLGNKESLSWMVNNVIHNAAKFAPQGDEVRVALDRHEGGIVLEVENSAAYDADVKLTQASKPFTRLEGVHAKGYGLGLAIAARAADRHKGNLSISRGRKGFLVRILL